MNVLITSDKDVVVRPSDLNIEDSNAMIQTFGKSEIELDAQWILRYCAKANTWKPFSKIEFLVYYNKETGNDNFEFRGLIEPFDDRPYGGVCGGGYLIEKNGMIFFTQEFIKRASRNVKK